MVGTGFQGSGHNTEPVGVEEAFGQRTQTHGLIFGCSWVDPGVGINDPCHSYPTWDIF